MIAVIYKNNKEIDRGIITSSKHYTKDYPDQSVTICDRADAYSVENERDYEHSDKEGIRFEEYQDRIMVYCSVEKIDKSINYGVPSWFQSSSRPIPNYETSVGEDGEENKQFKGYVK
jgi:hypothetical protein